MPVAKKSGKVPRSTSQVPSTKSLKSQNPVKNARTSRRAGSPPSVKSGFSLYSAEDSEDSVSAANKGLDKCVALLAQLLDTDQERRSMSTSPKSENVKHAKKKTIEKKKAVGQQQHPSSPYSSHKRAAFGQSNPTVNKPKEKNAAARNSVVRIPTGSNVGASRSSTTGDSPPVQLSTKSHPMSPFRPDPTITVAKQTTPGTPFVTMETEPTRQPVYNKRLISSTPHNLSLEDQSTNQTAEPLPHSQSAAIPRQGSPPRDSKYPGSSGRTSPAGKKSPRLAQLQTLKYLLRELRAVASLQEDVEVHRIINELEHTADALPYLSRDSGEAGVAENAEMAGDLHMLRRENGQLKKRLRVANRQLQEREKAEKETRGPAASFELATAQANNTSLLQQLKEEKLRREDLLKQMDQMSEEIKKIQQGRDDILQSFSSKESEHQRVGEEWSREVGRIKGAVEEALSQVKSLQLQLEASRKECHILELTLRQRDTEVDRYKDLNKGLQQSVASLLQELQASGPSLRNRPAQLEPPPPGQPFAATHHPSEPVSGTARGQGSEAHRSPVLTEKNLAWHNQHQVRGVAAPTSAKKPSPSGKENGSSLGKLVTKPNWSGGSHSFSTSTSTSTLSTLPGSSSKKSLATSEGSSGGGGAKTVTFSMEDHRTYYYTPDRDSPHGQGGGLAHHFKASTADGAAPAQLPHGPRSPNREDAAPRAPVAPPASRSSPLAQSGGQSSKVTDAAFLQAVRTNVVHEGLAPLIPTKNNGRGKALPSNPSLYSANWYESVDEVNSQVSSSTITSQDERLFREGLVNLDADIARLQRDLHQWKSK